MATKDLQFKFRIVKEDGQLKGFFTSKRGLATRDHLLLDNQTVPYTNIQEVIRRDKRLFFVDEHDVTFGIEVYKIEASVLEKHINRIRSFEQAKRHKEHLEAEGKGDTFRALLCPECEAMLDLTPFESSAYTYCEYCETVLDRTGAVVTKGSVYSVCDECGMFDRVRSYTEFYFYLLLVLYGFSHNRRHVCDGCAHSLFKKTFIVNAMFILGVPSAIWIKIKSMTGRDPGLKKLAKANALALKGKSEEAAGLYHSLYQQFEKHPGLLRNEGLGYLIADEGEVGLQKIMESIESCSSYLPSIAFLNDIHEPEEDEESDDG